MLTKTTAVGALVGALALIGANAFAASATTVDPGQHDGPQGAPTLGVSTAATPAAVPAISSAQIVANAETWYIGQDNPPYSQSAYWASRTDYAGDASGDDPQPGGSTAVWREDCSGFLSHAWGVITSGGGFTTYTMPSYSTPIAWSALQPGDAILFNNTNVPGYGTVAHVGLFMGWTTATTYSVLDESAPGTGTHVQTNIPLGTDGFWEYGTPVRYDGFTSSGTSGVTQASTSGGYWELGAGGGVYNFGASFFGSMGGVTLTKPVVSGASTPDRKGYYEVASDGGIFAFGDASFHGSAGGLNLVKPMVGMAVDPATGGYWTVASDGGIFAYGAPFYGSMGGRSLNKPIVAMASTPDGKGYWLVASDGGIFSFGDAAFHGSTGALTLNQPIVGMSSTPTGTGYTLVASDGGIFAFNAPYYGSTGAMKLNKPVVGMADDASGGGYWLVASDGGIFTFGNAPFQGSTGGENLTAPIVAMTPGPS